MSGTEDVLAVAERMWTDGGAGGITPMAPGWRHGRGGRRGGLRPVVRQRRRGRTAEGLVLVDVGSPFLSGQVHRTLRAWSAEPLHTAVYSHGHIDHVFGVHRFEAEADDHGWPAPRVVAHEDVAARFDRYVATAGYNAVVNRRQFGLDELEWPTRYRYPDRPSATVSTSRSAGYPPSCTMPGARRTTTPGPGSPPAGSCARGDLFIWASPNAGNPQKVQRFPLEWAEALRRMLTLFDDPGGGPEVLLPGHGYPIMGADRIRQALTETAELLESLVAQTLELMNAGARLDEAIHSVTAPAHLLARPYLQPVYDEPEFVVRGVWRRYGGWWDGNPASLKPAPERALARELAAPLRRRGSAGRPRPGPGRPRRRGPRRGRGPPPRRPSGRAGLAGQPR